jgi:hypothetical protein
LGTAILRFESATEMLTMMDNMENDIRVRTVQRKRQLLRTGSAASR